MRKIKINKKKQVLKDMERFVAKLKDNPKKSSKKIESNKNHFLEFHLDTVNKIDREFNQVETERQKRSLDDVIEIREPWIKTPELTRFNTEITNEKFESNRLQSTLDNISIDAIDSYIDIEKPENIDSNISDDKFVTTLNAIGKIRVRKNKEKISKTIQKKNGYTKTKKELELAKIELERKKKEIEEIERQAKLKEQELKKKKENRKKREKLKKIEEKQKAKQAKLRKKEKIKKEKEKQKQLKALEKQKQIEERLKQKELEKKKKEELKKKKIEERENQLKQKELEKKKKIEEKQKLIEKLQKEKELEKQKKKKLKEKPVITAKKQEETEDKKIDSKWDKEVRQAFTIIDNLLEDLPEEKINEFVQSDDFAIYEKVVKRYKQNKR